MKTVLVIGANRGIGLELIRTFVDNGWRTIGSTRPRTLRENDPSVSEIIKIDYEREDTIIEAAKTLCDTDVKLDVLANCAADPWSGFKLCPYHLSAGNGGKIINIFPGSASIGDPDHDGESVSYRMAKAAVNSETKTLAINFKTARIPVTTTVIDPGSSKPD
ncbi:hypothetical protein F5Y10DRAFT_283357 [Nemania abortiva]|nr:hypothetical protein F5Y10DRAFT_283357 [Nemania abortiva]